MASSRRKYRQVSTAEARLDAVIELRRWLCGDSGRFGSYLNAPKEEQGDRRWLSGWGDGVRTGCLMMGWMRLSGFTSEEAKESPSSAAALVLNGSNDHYAREVERVANEGAAALGFESVNEVISHNDGNIGDVDAMGRWLDERISVLAEDVAYEQDPIETEAAKHRVKEMKRPRWGSWLSAESDETVLLVVGSDLGDDAA